jgi:hypothetical protein
VAAVNLLTTPSEQVGSAFQVGWGVGRDPGETVGDTSVTWGDSSTATKRWGVNVPKLATTVTYDSYSYTAIGTYLGATDGTPPGVGADESASTLNDSGSGLFQNIGGTWYLIGLTTVVQTNGISNYANDTNGSGDLNAFVRISTYASALQAAVIPEPSAYALFALGLGAIACTGAFRRRKT